jgi:hypothetical protein
LGKERLKVLFNDAPSALPVIFGRMYEQKACCIGPFDQLVYFFILSDLPPILDTG